MLSDLANSLCLQRNVWNILDLPAWLALLAPIVISDSQHSNFIFNIIIHCCNFLEGSKVVVFFVVLDLVNQEQLRPVEVCCHYLV